jgi:uncharacterized protein YecE (DUF72 family)
MIHVGTSGWVYPHWRGRFYPPGLPASRWLEFLASTLPTVEVNATFYSLTSPRACDRWRAVVAPEFLFALKGSRYITHMKQLRGVETALANFYASGILRLGAQLGPVLWQLPPRLRFDRAVAGEFFRLLPRDVRAAEKLARRHDARVAGRACLRAPDGRDAPIRYALEARHASWMGPEAAQLLRDHELALVWADTAGEHPATESQTTGTLAYVRLHGSRRIYEGRYTTGELEEWARRAREWARDGTAVFVYFDNDRDAAAAQDARRLVALCQGRVDPERVDEDAGERAGSRAARAKPAHFAFRVRQAGG